VPIVSDNPPLTHALAYSRLEWHAFPLAPRSKAPAGSLVPRGHLEATREAARLTHWFDGHPELGIGVAMAPSGLVLVDVDPRHGGDETLHELESRHGELPATPEAVTGGGGAHYMFTRPADMAPHDYIALWPGIDVKAAGYAVVAPSIHPDTGRPYLWALGKEPGRIPVAPLPDWIRAAMAAHRNGRAPAGPIADRILEGGRNAALASIAGSMRRRGVSVAAIEAALIAENAERCDPPLPEAEVEAIARSVGRYAPEPQRAAPAPDREPDLPREIVIRSAEAEVTAGAEAPTQWLVEGLLASGTTSTRPAWRRSRRWPSRSQRGSPTTIRRHHTARWRCALRPRRMPPGSQLMG